MDTRNEAIQGANQHTAKYWKKKSMRRLRMGKPMIIGLVVGAATTTISGIAGQYRKYLTLPIPFFRYKQHHCRRRIQAQTTAEVLSMGREKLRKEIEELRRLLHDRLSEPVDEDDRWARYLHEYSLEQRQRLLDCVE